MRSTWWFNVRLDLRLKRETALQHWPWARQGSQPQCRPLGPRWAPPLPLPQPPSPTPHPQFSPQQSCLETLQGCVWGYLCLGSIEHLFVTTHSKCKTQVQREGGRAVKWVLLSYQV